MSKLSHRELNERKGLHFDILATRAVVFPFLSSEGGGQERAERGPSLGTLKARGRRANTHSDTCAPRVRTRSCASRGQEVQPHANKWEILLQKPVCKWI